MSREVNISEAPTRQIVERFVKQLFCLKRLLERAKHMSKQQYKAAYWRFHDLRVRLDETRQILAREYSFESLLYFHIAEVLIEGGLHWRAVIGILDSAFSPCGGQAREGLRGCDWRLEDFWDQLSEWIVEAPRLGRDPADKHPNVWEYIPDGPVMRAASSVTGRKHRPIRSS
jgi:hypothetical protein